MEGYKRFLLFLTPASITVLYLILQFVVAIPCSTHNIYLDITYNGTDSYPENIIADLTINSTSWNQTITYPGCFGCEYSEGTLKVNIGNLNGSIGCATVGYGIRVLAFNNISTYGIKIGVVDSGVFTDLGVLNLEPSCNDGFKDGNESLVDCGGVCSPCYDLNLTPENEDENFYATSSGNFSLYIYNVGYNNLTDIKFNTSFAGHPCNFTIDFIPENILRIGGTSSGNCSYENCTWNYAEVLVNKSIGNLPSGTYACNITVSSNENATGIVRVTIDVASTMRYNIDLTQGWNLISFPLESS